MRYIVIPAIKVQSANAMQAPWVVSPVPVFAATMLGHRIGARLGMKVTGVAYIHHNFDLMADSGNGFRRGLYNPNQFRGAMAFDKGDVSNGSKLAVALQPSVSTHISCSMVLRTDSDDASVDHVKRQLIGARLAGGTIIEHGKIRILDSSDGIQKYVGSGFVALDATSAIAGSEDPIADFLHETHALRQREEDGPALPWRTAATLGYIGVSGLSSRKGVKSASPDCPNPTLHAFAEPAVGLVDLISTKQIREQKKWSDVFWEWSWPQENIFLLATPNSQPMIFEKEK